MEHQLEQQDQGPEQEEPEEAEKCGFGIQTTQKCGFNQQNWWYNQHIWGFNQPFNHQTWPISSFKHGDPTNMKIQPSRILIQVILGLPKDGEPIKDQLMTFFSGKSWERKLDGHCDMASCPKSASFFPGEVAAGSQRWLEGNPWTWYEDGPFSYCTWYYIYYIIL